MAQAALGIVDKGVMQSGAAAIPWYVKAYNSRDIGVVSMGDIPRFRSLLGLTEGEFGLTGINTSIANAAVEAVSPLGTFAWRIAASQLALVSSSAADAAAGTGARTVQVVYLRTGGTKVTETVTMNGVTEVNLANSDAIRALSIRVLTAGSGGQAAGNITLQVSGGGTALYQIPADRTKAQSCIFTVPIGMIAIVTGFWGAANQADVEISACADWDFHNKTRLTASVPTYTPFADIITVGAAISPMYRPLPASPAFPELTDIYCVAFNNSGVTAKATAGLDLFLVEAG